METYFEHFADGIADITRDACIGLDLDQKLSRYRDPSDLLLIKAVTIRSSAGSLGEAAAAQAELVRRFMADDLAWFDPALRGAIIESAEAYGDLRARQLAIPDLDYHEVSNFYTDAFDGVFVLHAPESGNAYLILEDQERYQALGERRRQRHVARRPRSCSSSSTPRAWSTSTSTAIATGSSCCTRSYCS